MLTVAYVSRCDGPSHNRAQLGPFCRQTELSRQIAVAVVGEENVVEPTPTVAAEDLAYMLQECGGCYFWLGAGGEHNLHHPKYDFNDGAWRPRCCRSEPAIS